MSRRILPILTAVLSIALCGPLVSAARAQDYPRLGLYGSVTGDGTPFVKGDGSLDTTAIAQVARYDEVILDVNPLTPYRPDIAAALRARNPDIRILAYVLGHDIWPAADADSLRHYPTRYRRLVRDLGGFLYNRLDGQEYPGANVNLARRDANGRFVVAEGLADLMYDAIVSTGEWDGVFFDVYCYTISWSQDGTRQIDYARAGYPSLAAFESAWQAGSDTLANRLRRLTGPNVILAGNCAGSAHQGVFNGWMRENFPFQNGGTWYDNVLSQPHGYFADEANFVQPAHNWIFSAVQGADGAQYTAENARRVRFGLATAALGGGFGVFGPSDRSIRTANYHAWWYDEYAVDRATGRASTSLQHTGWLGQPLGAPYQMIWAGTNADAVSNPDFEANVSSGWSFGRFAPAVATFTRDTTTAVVGRASARISITTASTVDWHVNLTSVGSIPVSPGVSYSVTFWARASSPRVMPITATRPGGGAVATRNVTIGTEWTHFQVILQPSEAANSSLEFFLGTQAGDVWFDDVHFQQGATNLWRRDFQHGTVLVNPSDAALQVPMGSAWRRILGTVAPSVNDGVVAGTVSVGPSDAIFLLSTGTDVIPPAAITDVRVVP
ncbi:MAG: carbohydrate binding domain-containing protein [Candidatus Eisenbacteria bacterium]|uniref:Carbohydrate binding domain-containing protein n=1 Tax=Eiseniibacteriota bacterium TaxID=2212470 RepID=A0A933W3H8_UNCEI|nr:carbohydrate binding domain-containing protein [Candidatus Eisenbacteria bacterium]